MQPTNTTLFQIALLSIAICFSSTAFAKIYKWTDANGKTHYTATPPPTDEKAKTEEFKVQKIKKSSLTNINDSANNKANVTLSSKFDSMDHTVSAQSQCKKAAKKMPQMYSYIKNKIEESKLSGKMTDAQYKTALKEMKKSKKEQASFGKCVRDYNKGNHIDTDQVANNSPEQAFAYLLLKSQEDQKEMNKKLQFK